MVLLTGLTIEEAHTKIKTKVTETEGFIKGPKTVESLWSEKQAEDGDLRRKLENRLSILKTLWYAESDEVKFKDLSNWITIIEEEVKRTLTIMEVLTQVRKMRLNEHYPGVKTITDPSGVDVLLQDTEAATNTDIGLNSDAVEMQRTLTQKAGDTEEPRFMLFPKYMSELIAIPTGQSNPCFKELVDCGSEGHLARVCTTKMNLYTEINRGHAKQKGKMPASCGCWTGGAGANAQETNPL